MFRPVQKIKPKEVAVFQFERVQDRTRLGGGGGVLGLDKEAGTMAAGMWAAKQQKEQNKVKSPYGRDTNPFYIKLKPLHHTQSKKSMWISSYSGDMLLSTLL